MKELSETIKVDKEVRTAFLSDYTGKILDSHKIAKAEKLSAFAAYSAHCIKTIEDELGMQSLASLKVQGAEKSLLLSFEDDYILGIEGKKEIELSSLELDD